MSKPKTKVLRGVYDVARQTLPPLEFALRAPASSSSVFLYALASGVGLVLFLSVVLRVPVNLSFTGTLKLETPPTRLDTPQEKRVRRVLVREGEAVEKNEVLLELGGVLSEGEERDLSLFSSELRALLGSEREGLCESTCLERLERLTQERVPSPRASRPQELVREAIGALDDFLAVRTESGGNEAGARALSLKRESLREKAKALKAEDTKVDLRYEQEQNASELAEIEAQLRALNSKSQAGLGRAFASLDTASRELQVYVAGQFEERFVRSPIPGHITKIHVSGVDEVVGAGGALIDISPLDAIAVAELQVASRDVASIEEGHTLHLALDAFPVHRFGFVEAQVESIPRVAEATTGIGGIVQPTFKVIARPLIQSFEENGRILPLRSGMTLTGTYELRKERPFVLFFELLAGKRGQ